MKKTINTPKTIKPNKVVKDPLKEAEKLIEAKKLADVSAAAKKYEEFILKLKQEFGIEITYETIIKITKI